MIFFGLDIRRAPQLFGCVVEFQNGKSPRGKHNHYFATVSLFDLTAKNGEKINILWR
jgi:hypothetical protein